MKAKIYFPDDIEIQNKIFDSGFHNKPMIQFSLELAASNLIVIEQLVKKVEYLEEKLNGKK